MPLIIFFVFAVTHCERDEFILKKGGGAIEKVGNDQEKAQSERNSHSKTEVGKKTELTIRY